MYLLTKFTEFFVLDSISALNHQHCGGGDITSSVSCAGQPKWSPVSKQEICIHNILCVLKISPLFFSYVLLYSPVCVAVSLLGTVFVTLSFIMCIRTCSALCLTV